MKKIINTIKQNSMASNLNITVTWLAFVTSLLMLIKVLLLANVGVDLTDEGYYFNWISDPWLYKYYVSQFGYIYHPIYKFVGDSIIQLRQANMLISYGLSWALCYFVLTYAAPTYSNTMRLILSGVFAFPALFILMITGRWVPSPSYNSLNFQGCLIVALGFMYASFNHQRQSIGAMVLIGIGGWLVLMAKPSSALLVAIIAIFFFINTIKKDWRILLGATFVALFFVLITAFAIDGSIMQFIKRMQGGLILIDAMDSNHGLGQLFKLDFFVLDTFFKLKIVLLSAVLLVGFKCCCSKYQLMRLMVSVVLLLLLFITIHQIITPNTSHITVLRYHVLIILALLIAGAIYTFFNKNMANNQPVTKLIILLIVMPYIFAAGTGNNYWQTASGAMIFWICASILLLSKANHYQQTVNVAVSFVAIISCFAIIDAMRDPYRQAESLLEQTQTYTDPYSQQQLTLTKDTINYLKSLNSVMKETGFMVNTPVIDLTGHHPGALYFMQAKPIGQAWTIGGYKGSNPLAALALNQASCKEIASAWLLLESEGVRQVSTDILSKHGITFSRKNYQLSKPFKTQTLLDFGARNQKHPNARYNQYLAKPLKTNQHIASCLAYRNKNKNALDRI